VNIDVTNSRLSLRSSVKNFFAATPVVLYVHSTFHLMAIKQSDCEAIHGRIGKHPIHACIACRITTGVFYVIIAIIIAIVLVVVVLQMVSPFKRSTGRYLCSVHTAQYIVNSSGAADPVIAAPFGFSGLLSKNMNF
jgi:hypothetical protein